MNKLLAVLLLSLAAGEALGDEIGIRVRFGLKDRSPTSWDGTVTVTPGRVALIGGWRFAATDKVDGTTGWKASTRPVAQDRRSNNPKKAGARGGGKKAGQPMADNGVLI